LFIYDLFYLWYHKLYNPTAGYIKMSLLLSRKFLFPDCARLLRPKNLTKNELFILCKKLSLCFRLLGFVFVRKVGHHWDKKSNGDVYTADEMGFICMRILWPRIHKLVFYIKF
jgi:hypothetical protein